MAISPQQYYFDFSYDYCDTSIIWGERGLTWGKGAAWDMEGYAHLIKMLPHPCYGSYISAVTQNSAWSGSFSDFKNSGKDKIAVPYKFLQILDPDAFSEIQQTHYHSIAHAIRNAADVSRACSLFFEAKQTQSDAPFYEWEGRGATETIYQYANNSLVKGLIFSGPDIIPTGASHLRYLGGSPAECGPLLLGATYGCVCKPPSVCPPDKKKCLAGGDEECDKKSGYAKAKCAAEPWPYWPTGDAPPLSGFPFKNLSSTTGEYIHAGYFIRKSYPGYANLTKESDTLFTSTDPDALIKYAQNQNGFNYQKALVNKLTQEPYYTTKTNIPINPLTGKRASMPVKRIKNIMKVDNIEDAKDFLYNGYGIVLSTNVGFSNIRDDIGISYPDRLWYHTMAIIGYDDTRRIHPDTLFLIANSWGDWNSGGHPNWGPLPKGSFLITGSHLACILAGRSTVEQIHDCNQVKITRCLEYSRVNHTNIFFRPPTSILDASAVDYRAAIRDRSEDVRWSRINCSGVRLLYVTEKACNRGLREEFLLSENCGDNCHQFDDCEYKICGPNQSPWGIAFALSFDESPPFKRKEMNYCQFVPCSDPTAANDSSGGCKDFLTFGLIDPINYGWKKISPTTNTLPIIMEFKFEDSSNCGGENSNPQGGTFVCNFLLSSPSMIKLKVEGDVEDHMATFDISELKVKGYSAKIEGQNNLNGCQMSSQMDETTIFMPAGVHEYTMTTDTADGLYHKDMIHRFTISIV
jgi:hypothetical protein